MTIAMQCLRLPLNTTDFENIQKFLSNAVFYFSEPEETSSSPKSTFEEKGVPKSTSTGRYYLNKKVQKQKDLDRKVHLLKEEIAEIRSIFKRYSEQKMDTASAVAPVPVAVDTTQSTETLNTVATVPSANDIFGINEENADYLKLASHHAGNAQYYELNKRMLTPVVTATTVTSTADVGIGILNASSSSINDMFTDRDVQMNEHDVSFT